MIPRTRFALRSLFVLAALLGLLGGCGNGDDDTADVLRIHVETLEIDGPVPDGLHARHLAADGTPAGRYALVAVPGDRPGAYAIPGGPEGSYRLEPPEGWGVISTARVAPEIFRGRTPPVVRIGREATLYLGPLSPTLRPGARWGAERVESGGARTKLPVRVEVVPPGFGVGIRFDPEDWHGTIEVVGFLATGLPGAGNDQEPFADPLHVRVPEDGGPVVGQLRTAAVSRLQVIPVAAHPDVDVEGLAVRVEVIDLAVDVEREEVVHRGAARFAGLPALGRPLQVRIGAEGAAFLVSPEAWERASQLRLLWTGARPVREVRVQVPVNGPDARAVEAVQVRPAAAVAYGRVPFTQEGDEVRLSAPAGAFDVLLRAGTTWASAAGDGAEDLLLDASPFQEGVRIDGEVRGGMPTCEIRFFRKAGEGDEAVLADEFVVRLSRFGAYEALLPAGTYLVEVADDQGVVARPSPLDATTPGAAIHLPLHALGH